MIRDFPPHVEPKPRVPDYGRGCRGARCVRYAQPRKLYCEACEPFAVSRGKPVDAGAEIVPVEVLNDRGDVSCFER